MQYRVSFDKYFMRLAHVVSSMSTCISRKVGAVVSKDKVPISMGFNGAAAGRPHCTDSGLCVRRKLGIPSRQRMELCEALHAEENALLFAGLERSRGSTIYITQEPCEACIRRILNCKISRVVIGDEEWTTEGREALESKGVICDTSECPYLEIPVPIPPPYK